MMFVNNNEGKKKKLTGSSYTQNVLKCLPLFNFIWLVRYHKSSSISITCFTYYGIVKMIAVDMKYLFYICSVNLADTVFNWGWMELSCRGETYVLLRASLVNLRIYELIDILECFNGWEGRALHCSSLLCPRKFYKIRIKNIFFIRISYFKIEFLNSSQKDKLQRD